MTDPQPKPSGAWRAVLFLFVLATLIPELLIGSTPLSRIHTLLFQLPYYGSAALVIREMYRPELDVVRSAGVDDPAGGVFDGLPDRQP